jgi:hypothetical protein
MERPARPEHIGISEVAGRIGHLDPRLPAGLHIEADAQGRTFTLHLADEHGRLKELTTGPAREVHQFLGGMLAALELVDGARG